MYNAHRGMAQPTSRLEEYITGIRQEFESATNGASESDQRSQFSCLRIMPYLAIMLSLSGLPNIADYTRYL